MFSTYVFTETTLPFWPEKTDLYIKILFGELGSSLILLEVRCTYLFTGGVQLACPPPWGVCVWEGKGGSGAGPAGGRGGSWPAGPTPLVKLPVEQLYISLLLLRFTLWGIFFFFM